jgi:hypothetical protein
MPAIQPARLRKQALMLAEHFDNPGAFVRSLHYLLEYYADRTRKPGQSGSPPPLIKTYNIRPPILKQVLLEIAPLCRENPVEGIALCDRLWEESYFEFQLLAIYLLGEIPPDPPEHIISRIQSQMNTELDPSLLDPLLRFSLSKIRTEHPKIYAELVSNWIKSEDYFHIQMGLLALLPLIQDSQFENLPIIFKMIQPLVRSSPPAVKPDLLDVLTALAHKSPSETAFFLQHNLTAPNAIDTAWIIRQLLNEFPIEIGANLRKLSRKQRG